MNPGQSISVILAKDKNSMNKNQCNALTLIKNVNYDLKELTHLLLPTFY